MKKYFNNTTTDKQRTFQTGALGVCKQTPVTTQNHNNPQSNDEAARSSGNEHNGMLGSLMFDALLGGAFFEAVTETLSVPEPVRQGLEQLAQTLDTEPGKALEMAHEFWLDRQKKPAFRLCQGGTLTGCFNDSPENRESDPTPAWQIAQYGRGSHATQPGQPGF